MSIHAILGRFAAGAAALAAASLASFGPATAANNIGLDTIELKIVNTTGNKGDLYMYVWGQSGDTWYYVTDTNGDVSAYSPSSDYETIGINIGSKKRISVELPQLSAARVYFSLGKAMQVTVGSNNAPSTPSGWTIPSSTVENPNYRTIFDWFEYTWADVQQPSNFTTSFNGNLTQVDMVGIPMLLRLNGQNATQQTVFTAAGFSNKKSRAKLMRLMQKAPKPWNKLIVGKNRKVPFRVVSPYNGMDLGGGIGLGTFPSDFLDSYIDSVWSKYASTHMLATTTGPSATFHGLVQGGSLVFTNAGNPGNTVTFAKPTSLMAFNGYLGTLSNPGDSNLQAEGAELARYLQAGLMRTTILKNGNISACPKNPNKVYYKNAPVNQYSKRMHRVAHDHKAYGFGWDDVCDQASDFTVFDPNFIKVKLLPLKAK